MRKIEIIWQELELERAGVLGMVFKRYSPAVMPDLFVALSPQNERSLAILIKKENVPSMVHWTAVKEFKLELLPDKANVKNTFILIRLLDAQFSELFAVLCEDLIFKVFNTLDELRLIQTICNSFSKWKKVFNTVASTGLDVVSQDKLYGELYFIRKLLQKKSRHVFCIESWQSPVGSSHDFQRRDWAVQVKTTEEYENQEILISNERQLDDTLIPHIYLVQLDMDVSECIGENINDIIRDIRELLSKEQMAINSFERLLHDAGYFNVHAELYQIRGYKVRNMSIYHVEKDFPRILVSQLAKGVTNVKYTINASDLEPFRIEEYTFFQEFRV